jgi:hypothetical protein
LEALAASAREQDKADDLLTIQANLISDAATEEIAKATRSVRPQRVQSRIVPPRTYDSGRRQRSSRALLAARRVFSGPPRYVPGYSELMRGKAACQVVSPNSQAIRARSKRLTVEVGMIVMLTVFG